MSPKLFEAFNWIITIGYSISHKIREKEQHGQDFSQILRSFLRE